MYSNLLYVKCVLSHFNLQPSGLGTFLALTGERLRGEDCLHAGVATHMCKRESVPALEEELKAATGLQACRDIVEKYDANFDKSGSFGLSDRLGDIEAAFTGDTMEDILVRLKGRGEWGQKLRKKLLAMSPTSLKVVLQRKSFYELF